MLNFQGVLFNILKPLTFHYDFMFASVFPEKNSFSILAQIFMTNIFLGTSSTRTRTSCFFKARKFCTSFVLFRRCWAMNGKKKILPSKFSAKRAGFCCKFSIPSHLLDEGLGEVAEVAVWAVNKSCLPNQIERSSRWRYLQEWRGSRTSEIPKKNMRIGLPPSRSVGTCLVSKIYVLEKQLVL